MVRFDTQRGLVPVPLDEHVRLCIQQMLFTRLGERSNHPTLGTRLDRFLYRRMSSRWTEDLSGLLREAIQDQEPRVEMKNVTFDRVPEEPSRVQIRITYRIRESQKMDSLRVVV